MFFPQIRKAKPTPSCSASNLVLTDGTRIVLALTHCPLSYAFAARVLAKPLLFPSRKINLSIFSTSPESHVFFSQIFLNLLVRFRTHFSSPTPPALPHVNYCVVMPVSNSISVEWEEEMKTVTDRSWDFLTSILPALTGKELCVQVPSCRSTFRIA